MARILRMPEVAADTAEAMLADWLVGEADEFAAADPIATVETEKAAVEIEADAAGVLLKLLVPAGAQVEVGSPIAVLGEPGESVADVDALLVSLGVGVVTDPVLPERRDVEDPPPAAAAAEPQGPVRVFASPLARRLAAEAGLEIERLRGSGPRGRVLRRDVEQAVADRPAPAAPPAVQELDGRGRAELPARPDAPDRAGEAPYEEVPHTRIRRATASRLVRSKQEAPHFYLRAALRADRLMALREELNAGVDKAGRVSVNDLVVRAVALAGREVPDLNVTWTDAAVRRYRTVDVAVAVSTDQGLLTPVVRDPAGQPIGALASTLREAAARARAGRLRPDELEGGSICVTNLGMYDVDEFAAIINPPHAAILAVGAVREEPVVEAGSIVVGRVMRVTLSVDHRPVDGAVAARWLTAFRGLVEHPIRILG
ncbi:2-oxo acid dehydrogenase subunit E2 [Nocardioides sp. LMS-CY]|uniref:dihydrolipoamide acetyltransferase family protein n=1 Tax=Nocardioides sp. (strain LMS-CY) TaxID=2840457 RepID=UPI001BFFFEB2|nr:dihydrolipoamide acetyltransferase family protein [Nocardioides sp. LMS-CY]QWF20361.1 2-oxo acid dehydrogenase subunit E2 [Nocardioides sp. LMS-CY]